MGKIMQQQKFIRLTLLAFFCVLSLSLQGCDDIKQRWQAYKAKSTQEKAEMSKGPFADYPMAMDIGGDIQDNRKKNNPQDFSVLPANVDITNPADPTSIFLAKVRKHYPNAVALYAGVYEPDGEELTLDIPYINKPVILYLGSYEAVKWRINPLADTEDPNKRTDVVAVVYGSYDDVTEIRGVAKEKTFDAGGRLSDYDNKSDCSCAGGTFHCESIDVFQAMGAWQHRYGIPVINYATDYSSNHLSFTNIDTPINFAQQATKHYQEQKRQRQQCVARTHPNYENTYQNSRNTTQNTMTFYGDSATYKINTGLNASHIKETENFENHLYKFPTTNSTWGDYLNPKNKVSDVGYTAYYMNANNVKAILQKSQVSAIEKKFAYDEFLGIPSDKFNAYWVGVLKVPKSDFYNVQFNKSWSGGRVSIDRHIIIGKGLHNETKKVFLPQGNHIIEVEYSNGWHTTDVQVMVKPLSQIKPPQDPTYFLANIKQQYPNVVALSASVYEANQQSVVINVPKSVAPVVLYLSSYETVKWQIYNPNYSQIVGVVYGSYEQGSEVQGIAQNKVMNIGRKYVDNENNLTNHCLSKKNKISSFYDDYGIKVVEYVGKSSADYLGFQQFLGNKCQ